MSRTRVPRRVGSALVSIGSLLLVTYVATQWFCVGWAWASGGRARVVMVADGKVVVGRSLTVWPDGSSWWGSFQHKLPAGLVLMPIGSTRTSWGYSSSSSSGVTSEEVRSFSLILPGLGALGVGLYIVARTPRGREVCRQCGYSLRGNTTGVCPECGTKTRASAGNNPS